MQSQSQSDTEQRVARVLQCYHTAMLPAAYRAEDALQEHCVLLHQAVAHALKKQRDELLELRAVVRGHADAEKTSAREPQRARHKQFLHVSHNQRRPTRVHVQSRAPSL